MAGFVLGSAQYLQLPRLKPAGVAELTADDKPVTITLPDASPFARVHIFAARYVPEYGAFSNLARVPAGTAIALHPGHASAVYLTGRDIDDEYRYVLVRKYANKFPRNVSARPELLLHPWAVRETQAGEQEAKDGDEFRAAGTKGSAQSLQAIDKAKTMSRQGSGSGEGEC